MARRPRPDFPGPGQESVWDYPRPPVLRESAARIWIILGGVVICETSHSWQVLETSHPPSYYLPRQAFLDGALAPGDGASVCEWKGSARYLDVRGGDRVAPRAAWFYPTPTAAFAALADHVAVYPEAMDECRVDGERVRAQPGGFYGGWITATVSGPFKGIPGSNGW